MKSTYKIFWQKISLDSPLFDFLSCYNKPSQFHQNNSTICYRCTCSNFNLKPPNKTAAYWYNKLKFIWFVNKYYTYFAGAYKILRFKFLHSNFYAPKFLHPKFLHFKFFPAKIQQ
jgi:hypothetical protein